MDIQEAFLRDILASPDDPAPRLIYADWLEESGGPEGPPRSEFLRLELALAAAPQDERRSEMEDRLRELRAAVDPDWLAALAKVPVENCRIRFKFECPKRWEKLTLTDDASVRFCDSCRKTVHYCHTIDEARDHAFVGHCVAVDLGVERVPGDLEPRPAFEGMTLGVLIDPAEYEADSNRFLPGDPVTVTRGRFRGLEGEVERVHRRGRHATVAIWRGRRRVSIEFNVADLEATR